MKKTTSVKLQKPECLILLKDGRLAIGINGFVFIYNTDNYKYAIIINKKHHYHSLFWNVNDVNVLMEN